MLLAALILQTATLGGDEVTEASGLVASTTQRGILWTNNDSGDGPYLYAFDAQGRPKATVLVRNAHAQDWEDLATGPYPGKSGTWIYAADIGDNPERRTDVCVYAIPEPKIGRSSKARPLLSAEAIRIRIRYPEGKPHNAEALLCDPREGRLTIVTKSPDGVNRVFRLPAIPSERDVNEVEEIARLNVPSGPSRSPLITGGAYRPDGLGVAFVTYSHLYEFSGAKWWLGGPVERPLPKLTQCEAVAFSPDSRSIFLTSEGKRPPLIRINAGFRAGDPGVSP